MAAALNLPAFFGYVRKEPFSGRLTPSQVSGMQAILTGCPATLATDALAYCLATALHETARTMQPIAEYGHGKGRAYGRPAGPHHQVFYGRGLVQLTWDYNYARATKELRALGILTAGEDLTRTPDLATRPDAAVAILFAGMEEGWFTGKKLADYVKPGSKSDFLNARRIINGTDCAGLIRGYAEAFRTALQTASHAPEGGPVATLPPPKAPPKPAPKPVALAKKAKPAAKRKRG